MNGTRLHVRWEMSSWNRRHRFKLLDWLNRLLLSLTHMGGIGTKLRPDAFFQRHSFARGQSRELGVTSTQLERDTAVHFFISFFLKIIRLCARKRVDEKHDNDSSGRCLGRSRDRDVSPS